MAAQTSSLPLDLGVLGTITITVQPTICYIPDIVAPGHVPKMLDQARPPGAVDGRPRIVNHAVAVSGRGASSVNAPVADVKDLAYVPRHKDERRALWRTGFIACCCALC